MTEDEYHDIYYTPDLPLNMVGFVGSVAAVIAGWLIGCALIGLAKSW